MSEIVMIEGKHLHAHPDNPRKNLGDLTELSQSIKKNGILQNLTVVPMEEPGEYRVIIGHRRLAAGQIINLQEYPCVISDMDPHQQFVTMLEENMQRNDLTIPEQAYGFQMMFDWGNSIKDIAEKTGFSEQTVKHRLEMAKLDKKSMKSAEELQLSLKDYIELERLTDIKHRQQALSGVTGRSELMMKINRLEREEKIEKNFKKLEPVLADAGIEKTPEKNCRWKAGYSTIQQIDLENKLPKKLQIPKAKDGTKLLYENSYGTCYIIEYDLESKKTEASKKSEKEKKKEKDHKALQSKVSQMCKELKAAITLIYERKISSARLESETMSAVWEFWKNQRGWNIYASNMYEITGKRSYQVDDTEKKEIRANIDKLPMSSQFLIMLRSDIYPNRISPFDYDNKYREDDGRTLTDWHNLLKTYYGFEWSDPELAKIADGTHELYAGTRK